MIGKRTIAVMALAALAVIAQTGCGGPAEQSASQAAVQSMPTPDGRILTANQAANTITVIDVASDTAYGSTATGAQPHHVVATPDGREFWVSLYGEPRVQVFDAQTLKEAASVEVGAGNDDLAFDPEGKRLYVSMGQDDAVAVVDVAARKVLQTVKVGKTPHGLRVTPDGKWLLATNTADNTLSVLKLGDSVTADATIKTGSNPFEVTVTADSATAYVSNFLGDSISVVDLASRKTTGYIKSGKQPAMLALQEGGSGGGGAQIWVANTASAEVWLIDATTRKLDTRIPSGKGSHGTVITPGGKLYVTNTNDNSVTVIDTAARKVLTTIPVGTGPNGLTFLPNTGAK